MKKLIKLTIWILVGAASSNAQEPNMEPYQLAMEQPYKEGEVIVKFKDDQNISFYKSGDLIITGRSDLDAALAQWSVQDASQVFRNTVRKNETRTNTFPDGTQRPLPQFHNIFLLSFPKTNDPLQVAEALNALEDVEYAEPNLTFFITGTKPLSPLLNEEDLPQALNGETGGVVPNDPLYNQQWYLPHIKADQVWNTETGDDTQVIAIMDTGVDWTHPDLQNKIWQNPNETLDGHDSDGNGFVDDIRGWDFVNNNNNPMDDNSHGTHCAGLAAAETDNGIGMAGVSWGARIMPVKVFQSNGTGYTAQIAEGIWYAANNGATISSNSWGGDGESITIRLAFEYAYFHGPIVAAAGNSARKIDYPFPPMPFTNPSYPACYGWVIGVEATDPSGWNAWFSNFDPSGPVLSDERPYGGMFFNYNDYNYEVRAPGLGLISTVPGGQYRVYSGTSMAAPLVAGGIALMKSQEPELSNEMIFAKLIQPVKLNMFQAGVMDIYKSVTTTPPPDLYYISYEMMDTINGGNGNGNIDLGETIELYITAKNAGGPANNVNGKLRFTEFEDQSTATIIQNTCNIGPMSAYATAISNDAFIVEITEDLAHGRVISFEMLLWEEGTTDTIYTSLPISVFNGIEIAGVYEGTLHLESDGYYIVSSPAIIDTLVLDPGTTLRFQNSYLMIYHHIQAVGTAEERITFKGADNGVVLGIRMTGDASSHFEYCIFRDGSHLWDWAGGYLINPQIIKHSVFEHNENSVLFNPIAGGQYKYNVFTENSAYDRSLLVLWDGHLSTFKHNLIASNAEPFYGYTFMNVEYPQCMDYITHNAFLGRYSVTASGWNGWPMGIYYMKENYWGTTNMNEIKSNILDFHENNSLPVLEPDTILEIPPPEIHGFVWKVEINGENPQYGLSEPVGPGVTKFDVYFNRPMDTSYEPFVTFGLRYPFVQHQVADNASWSEDATVYTAYHDMSMFTGDGINTIRVAHARDTEGFEIPIERSRFNFSLQVANALSSGFSAEPGIGKITLQWPPADEEALEVMGYNLYRFKMHQNQPLDTIMLNSSLIAETSFIDHNVSYDSTYYYTYTYMFTDLTESDYSQVVSSSPHAVATGDANGDYSVDVMDIVAIVSYMLGQDPQPFIFEAADVNQDGLINVLDIVGVIDIVMGDKNHLLPKPGNHPDPAYVYLNDDIMQIESDGQLAALQFELHTAWPELISLTSLLPGFELGWTTTEDGIFGILFSMTNKTIPEGITDIVKINHSNPDLQWQNIFGADPEGRYVEIFTTPVGIDEDTSLPMEFSMELFPNPANTQFTINYFLPVISDVNIDIYDLFGRKLHTISQPRLAAGEHFVTKNTARFGTLQGLVLVRMTATGANGNIFSKTSKLMISE